MAISYLGHHPSGFGLSQIYVFVQSLKTFRVMTHILYSLMQNNLYIILFKVSAVQQCVAASCYMAVNLEVF